MLRVFGLLALLLCIIPASSHATSPNDVLGQFISPQAFSDGLANAPAGVGVIATLTNDLGTLTLTDDAGILSLTAR